MNTSRLQTTINELNEAIKKLESSKNISIMYWAGTTKEAYDSVVTKLISDINTEISILNAEIINIREFENRRAIYFQSLSADE